VTPVTPRGDIHVTQTFIKPTIKPSEPRNNKIDNGRLSDDLVGSTDAAKRDDVTMAFEIWNEICPPLGLVKAERLSRGRRELIAERLAEAGGIDGWRRTLQRIARSGYLCGDKGWKADFDFVLVERNFLKIFEGGYDDRDPPSPASPLTETSNISPGLIEKLWRCGGRLTQTDIKHWIEPCTLTEQAITAPTKFMADYIEAKFGSSLRRAFGQEFEIMVGRPETAVGATSEERRRA